MKLRQLNIQNLQVHKPSIRDHKYRPLWFVGTILTVCIVAQYVNYKIMMNSSEWGLGNISLVLMSLADFLPWLFIAPIVIPIAKRFPPTDFKSLLIFHLPASLISTFSILAFTTVVRMVVVEPLDIPFLERFNRIIQYEFTSSFMLYWFLIGTMFMFLYNRNYKQSADKEIQLISEKAQLQKELLSSRIDALNSQFKPHFLFNSLHTVSALMEIDVPKARDALISISQLLRSTLKYGDINVHKLSEEVDWLRNYIAVEQLRATTTLHFRVTFQNEAQNFLIPPMLLQPLVENSIQHSKVIDQKDLIISLSVTKNGNALCLVIDDNGGRVWDHDIEEGFGIKLVRDRLRLQYRNHASLQYMASPLKGTRVQIDILDGE